MQLHAGAGPSYVFVLGVYTTFAALDTWIELTLDLAEAQAMVSGFVANDIRQIGLQFSTAGILDEGGTFRRPGRRRIPHRFGHGAVARTLPE